MRGQHHNIRGTILRFQNLAKRDFNAAVQFGRERIQRLEESGHRIEPSQFELLKTSLDLMESFSASEDRRMEEQARRIEAEQIALTDALTGVGNRRALDKAVLNRLDPLWRGAKESERSGPETEQGPNQGHIVFALLDIDNFKPFNDTFGHDIGDEVLRKIGNLYGKSFRQGDFFARYGGEEFGLILYYPPGKDVPSDKEIRERIRQPILDHLADMYFVKDGEISPISFSIGLAHRDSTTIDPQKTLQDEAATLIKEADENLYADKDTKPFRLSALKDRIRDTVLNAGSQTIDMTPEA